MSFLSYPADPPCKGAFHETRSRTCSTSLPTAVLVAVSEFVSRLPLGMAISDLVVELEGGVG